MSAPASPSSSSSSPSSPSAAGRSPESRGAGADVISSDAKRAEASLDKDAKQRQREQDEAAKEALKRTAPPPPTGEAPYRLTKVERLYILAATLSDHVRGLVDTLPPREAPDPEVDDVEVTRWLIELDLMRAGFMFEYIQLAGRSLSALGMDVFLEEGRETAVAERRKQLAEKEKRALTPEEEIAMRKSIQADYERQRALKRGKYPKHKSPEESMRERRKAAEELRKKSSGL